MHRNDTALLVIDLQPDFMPGGALPCAEGDAIVPGIAALLARLPWSLQRVLGRGMLTEKDIRILTGMARQTRWAGDELKKAKAKGGHKT